MGARGSAPFTSAPSSIVNPILPLEMHSIVRTPSARRTRFVLSICEHAFVRWDNLKVERQEGTKLAGFKDPAVVRTFDAPEALGINFYEVNARSALNRVPKRSRMPFRWTINPYRGCSHACTYCFARPSHTYLDFNAREDFERQIVVKVNVPELLRAELARPSWKRAHVALGTNTDPYQWVEGRYRLMEGIWEAMRDFANPCSVLTKSPLLLRDLGLMKQIGERTEFAANLSVPTLDEKAWRATEPHTPHPRKRLEAVAELNRAGIPTGILIAPLMPGINDSPEQVEEILELAEETGAVSIGGVGLHLRGEVREIWFDWLRQHRPDLIPRYEELYERGAYLPSPERERLSGMTKRGHAPPGRFRGRDPAPEREQVRSADRDRSRPGREQARPAQAKLF
jgi:DNA repair photolyase